MSTGTTARSLWERATEAQSTAESARLLNQAWEVSTTPLERALSAHYLSHAASGDDDRVRWARLSVESAAEAEFTDVVEYLPAIYLALAEAYRRFGDAESAQTHYLNAAEVAESLESAGAEIEDQTWAAITTGLAACGFVAQGLSEDVFTLIDSLVESNSFGALSVVLPAVLRCTGTDEQVIRLIDALESAYWTPGLIGDENRVLTLAAIAAARIQISADAAPQSSSAGIGEVSTADLGVVAESAASTVTDMEAAEEGGDGLDVPFRL
ncbi:hypothetical protein AAFP35_04975 [Gordonia sp. CPCC 206044]|uniref:hypothetical protein n=1 Tax=Gordonia sp. CPCC 206044 TaxID=3140793 RepID=UPI003AF38C85